tara:strand:- start:21816 stop:22949 length:1134 start_codon:yes stop_codon:yes gene_type:complete
MRRLHQGKFEAAIAKFTKAIQHQPENVDAYLGRSNAYYRMNELDKSLADCDTVIRLQPTNHFAFFTRGAIYGLKEDYPRSLAETTQCLKLQPDNQDALFNRACTFSRLGNTEEALVDFSKAILLSPSKSDNYIERGNLFFNTQQYSKAIEDYTQAMKLGYHHWELLVNRGYALEQTGDTQNSKIDFQQALELKPYDESIRHDPTVSSNYLGRGYLFACAEQYSKAVEDFNRASELGDSSAELLTYRGYAYLKMELFEKGIADYELAIEMDPHARDALIDLAWLLATCPAPEFRDGNRAIALALRNCEQVDAIEWYDSAALAAAYAEVGQFEDSVRLINEALEKAPELEKLKCKAQLRCYESLQPYRDPPLKTSSDEQ